MWFWILVVCVIALAGIACFQLLNAQNGGWKAVDLFPKLEDEVLLQDATYRGAVLTSMAFLAMGALAVVETSAYLQSGYRTTVFMDKDLNGQVRINFNLTMHDLSCDYATIDLWDSLGTQRQNVTANVEKWQLDNEGNRRMYQGRNRPNLQLDSDHEAHGPIAQLHENGVHAVEVHTQSWDQEVKEREFVFVDFFAPWCVWCQRLEPTWEKFAEDIEAAALPITVAKVNCVAEPDLCRAQRVMAFPTMRFFKHGEPVNAADYRSDRTVDALMDFAKRKLELESQYKQWPEARKAHATNWNPDHPGCMLVGHLLVNRVPGNFHVEARSNNHNLNAAMANLSHTVNHLSFGNDLSPADRRAVETAKVDLVTKFSPLDGTAFVTEQQHKSFHHYLKVVAGHYKLKGRSLGGRFSNQPKVTYHILATDQVMPYDEDAVPEAKFMYDVSPMAVVVEATGKPFYDYVTSLLAILGGFFTVISLFDSTLYAVFKPKAD